MAKDTFYFSHDYNCRTDEKVKLLIRKHGMNGYGVFWSIVEDLYNNANALRTDYEGIAYDLRTDIDTIKSVLNDFDLFKIEGDFFGSYSVERRLNDRSEKSKKASISASYRWNKEKEDANALKTDANASKNDAIKERKGKERKDINIDFELFWNLYDKKVGEKAKLKPKWDKLTDQERSTAMNHLPVYKLSQPDKKFRKNVETYLNNKSWNDEIVSSKVDSGRAKTPYELELEKKRSAFLHKTA
jgi:hypothetical protein